MSDNPAPPPRPRLQRLIYGFAFIGVIALLWVAVLLGSMLSGPAYRAAEVEDKRRQVVYTVRNAQALPGTDLLSMDIAADDGREEPYSGSEPDVRNILLVNRKTGESRRLLPDNSRRILSSQFLSRTSVGREIDEEMTRDARGAAAEPEKPPEFFVLILASAKEPDKSDLLVGSLASGAAGQILAGLDGVDEIWMQDESRLGLIGRRDRTLYHFSVDIPRRALVGTRKLEVG